MFAKIHLKIAHKLRPRLYMARIPISEYKAKTLLIGKDYGGLSVNIHNADKLLKTLKTSSGYVAKVDQGVKKRQKQGLVVVNVKPSEIKKYLNKFAKKGFENFLIEPLLPHQPSEEKYLSLERVREGIQILYSNSGGINIEDSASNVKKVIYQGSGLGKVASELVLEPDWLQAIVNRFNQLNISFIEINPLVVIDGRPHMLDCAALVDSAAAYFTNEWTLDNDVSSIKLSPPEKAVAELQASSASAFSLKLVNPNGGLGMLLSGGGASVAIADEVCNLGQADNLLNYGEYSGNPTTEETFEYTTQVLNLLLSSKAKKKALVIAGGVANFTDIKKTFAGVIAALDKKKTGLKKQKVKIFVRRGGPNEIEGLAMMKSFLDKNDLLGGVWGSETILTRAAAGAVEYIK